MTGNEGAFLRIEDLTVHYGGIRALNRVNMQVNQGQIVACIGANGAGKSTLLRTIAGIKTGSAGKIIFKNKALSQHAYQVVNEGIVLVPEGRRIFAPLTVRENLMLGAYSRKNAREIRETLETVLVLFPVLAERMSQRGGTLSGGEQQMLAVGRALMGRPDLLLLDEPSLGLAPIIVDALFEKIIQLNREMGLTILLVEQNASLALEFCHLAYVLASGEIRISGTGKDLLSDSRVKESYLGVTTAASG